MKIFRTATSVLNTKRVYRIPVEEKLVVRRRKRRRRVCAQARVLLAPPTRRNETWTIDFLQDALATGRKVRTLSIEDAYTREMLAIEVDISCPALRVVRGSGEATYPTPTTTEDRDRSWHGVHLEDAGSMGPQKQ